jgi:hypothetical protein
MQETSSKNHLILAAIALLMGLFLVLIAPGWFDATQDTLILQQSKQGENLHSGPLSRLYLGSLYSGIEMLVGLALIMVAFPLYKREKWTWPILMLLLAIPAVANVYIGLGWIENIKRFPPVYYTFILSLALFWVALFLYESDRKTKNAMFWVYTLLGMIAAQGFALFPHALRVILRDPAQALLEPSVAVLRRSGPLMFLAFLLPLIAIWLLANRRESGWWWAILSGLIVAAGAFPVHYLRPSPSLVPADTLEASIFTSAYFLAGAMGVVLVILLLLPYFKSRLFDKEV